MMVLSETMWDLSTPEFGKLFARASEDFDLEGCTTPQQIDNALKHEIRKSKDKTNKSKVGVVRAYHAYRTEQLDKLIEKDFAGRAIAEANKNPKGLIAQTLLHGRKEALRRIFAQKRAQVRAKQGFKIRR
jgi:hypothetical protein